MRGLGGRDCAAPTAPERRLRRAEDPRSSAPTTGRSRDALPPPYPSLACGGENGRGHRVAAAEVARRGPAADAACGRADPTALARSAAAPPDRGRAACDWGYRAASRVDCRSFPSQTARAHRAREGERDQEQVIEIARFQSRNTGDSRRTKGHWQRFPASTSFRSKRGWDMGSRYVPIKTYGSGGTLGCNRYSAFRSG
jgi:hypothetical protein